VIQVSKLTIKDAELALEACVKKSAEIGVPMDIAISDESGSLLIFHRMDGAVFGCIQVAIDKAYTSAIFGFATGDEGKLAQPGQPDYGANTLCGGRVVIIAGGVPIIHKGAVLGAIGCSSGTPDQDSIVAQAGVAALIKTLS
jgi:uncharacterized protein GlcG (DUF336 family)